MRPMQRKSLLLVALNFPPSHGGGGLRIFRTYQRVLRMLPLDIVVITEAGRHYKPGWSLHEEMPVFALPPDSSAISLLKAFPAFLHGGGARRFATMHIAGFSRAAQLIGLAGLVAGIPVIAEMTVDPDPPGHRLRDRIALLAITRARLLIALNNTICAWFINIGVAPERIWLRPNPVDLALFRPPTAAERLAARSAFAISDDTCLSVVFGRFQLRKNQRLAVQALAHLPQPFHLLLAGPVFAEDQEYLSSVRGDIERLDLQQRVTIHAETVTDASKIYHAADQLWLTSTREGLPNVMLEALCCGVPVVANSQLNLHDHVVDKVNGRQASPDPQSFAEAAEAVLPLSVSPIARRTIADRARQAYDADRLCAEFAGHLAAVAGLPAEGAMK
jgi:glycosyltransferase involved in cell wall biosynthesis